MNKWDVDTGNPDVSLTTDSVVCLGTLKCLHQFLPVLRAKNVGLRYSIGIVEEAVLCVAGLRYAPLVWVTCCHAASRIDDTSSILCIIPSVGL